MKRYRVAFVIMLIAAILLAWLAGCAAPIAGEETTEAITAETATTTTEAATTTTQITTTAPRPPAIHGLMDWFPIGMSEVDLVAAAHRHDIALESPFMCEATAGTLYYTTGFSYHGMTGVRFAFYESWSDTLTQVIVLDPAFSTPQGIRVGDSIDYVRAAFDVLWSAGGDYHGEEELLPANENSRFLAAELDDGIYIVFSFGLPGNRENGWQQRYPDTLTSWQYGRGLHWGHRN